jgi:hypothetical protein
MVAQNLTKNRAEIRCEIRKTILLLQASIADDDFTSYNKYLKILIELNHDLTLISNELIKMGVELYDKI